MDGMERMLDRKRVCVMFEGSKGKSKKTERIPVRMFKTQQLEDIIRCRSLK